jgi:hypothetical protein
MIMTRKSMLLSFLAVLLLTGGAQANLIRNGDFENGLAFWNASGDVRVVNAGPFASAQGMDDGYALLGLGDSSGTSRISQDFEVFGATQLEISFNFAFDFFDNSYSASDTFIALVRQDGTPALPITLLDLTTHGTSFWNPDLGLLYGTYRGIVDISLYTLGEARVVFRLAEQEDSCIWTGTGSVAGIDNIVVASVAEPSLLLLGLAACGGLWITGRRRAA